MQKKNKSQKNKGKRAKTYNKSGTEKNKNAKIKENKRANKKPEEENTKENAKGKKKKVKFKHKHPRIALTIKIIIITVLLAIVIGVGVIAAMIYGMIKEDLGISKEDLIIYTSNTIIKDMDGNIIAELSGDEKRKVITLDKMSQYLPKAYVAIEDERFYEHSGIDVKRTGGAVVNYVLHGGNSSFGGSSITQQLVKNITQDDEDEGMQGALRKVKEWVKAYKVEEMLSKDQILELYLNIIFVGGKGYGVEIGSEYYFNKPASDLSIAECAFLAGINHSPNAYNPYKNLNNGDKIKNRTKTVLCKMKERSYITDEQYKEAVAQVNEGLKFEKSNSGGTVYSYHTDAVVSQVIAEVAKQKGISEALATTYVYSSGLTIYTTQVTSMQNELEKIYAESKLQNVERDTVQKDGTTIHQKAQSAMVIIDNKTGYVVACVGGLGEKTTSRGLNRATQSFRQPGSTIKPIADVVPGLEEGVITAATRYNDRPTTFTVSGNPYNPGNQGNSYKDIINVRQAVTISHNIPFVKLMVELTPGKSIDYLSKMGISKMDKNKDGLALAIGGVTHGISPLEMAAAYATIANNGVYRTPLFYTKVEDSKGNVVLNAEQKTEKVFSEQTAYVTKDILTSVVKGTPGYGGTGTYCAITGMDVAAKTGTTNGDKDRWLCGFTNYYSAATWFGYDIQDEVTSNALSKATGSKRNPAGVLWSEVMKKIHTGLEGSKFVRPDGVMNATVCKDTGLLAGEHCTNTYSEIFIKDKLPKECDAHQTTALVCTETGLLANEYCPSTETKSANYLVEKEALGLWNTPANAKPETLPTETCTTHKKPEEKPEEKPTNKPNTGTGNETGGNNTGTGNETGGNNTGTGNETGGSNTGTGNETGGSNTGTGNETGGNNTGTGNETGGNNTGTGNETGGNNTGAGNETGGNNTGTGNQTGGNNNNGGTTGQNQN